MTHLFTYTKGTALKLILALSLLTGYASAQNYPVQAHVVTTGPYLNYLSYYGDENNHLQITLTNTDFTAPSPLVRLRLRFEGQGWEVYTNPNATIGQPILLDAGMPVTISGTDLLPYLLQNNLINPSGIDLNNLPSGRIDVWVDVIRESASQQVLSSNNWGVINIADYAPPQAFVPSCGDQLDTNAMFHNFTWTPPVPFPIGLGIEVVYDFAIYHWVDPNNNSALGGNSILVYQQYDLVAPTTQVSDFDVQWQTGGTYLWTVTARVLSNGIPVSLIENGGVSAPCTFVYGEELSLTDQLADGLEIELFTEPSTDRKGKAFWGVNDNTPNQGLSDFDAFFVEYRKQPTGNEGFEIPWFSKTTTDTFNFIYQLEPSTTYEVKVSGVIAGSIGNPTPVKTLTTPDPRVYNCGEADMPFLPNTYTVLENATVGTQVQIGQFTMTMTEVNEMGGGHYAGKGTIPIAFLGGAKAKVRFDDILIDTEYRVHEGRVDVITQGLESWLDDQMIQFIDPYYVNGVIDSAWVDTTAGVAWVTVNGVDTSFTFNPPHHPIIVNDENGNQYTIYPNGTIVIGSFLAISENWNAMPDEVIHFAQNDSELRGFDGKEHIQWHENYEIMLLRDSSKYFVANKSMAKDEADYVNVEIPSGASASFQLSDGTPINASPLQGTWLGESLHTGSTKKTLTLPAQSSTGNYSIYAIVNNEKVGQLNIKVYSKKERELVVVPIASTNLTAAQIIAELDETLGEANIEVDVEITPQWTDTTGTFTASTNISLPTEVGLLTKYSDDMREIRDLYFEQNPNADKSKYYIFLVNGFDDPNELGYMVRGRAMGFVKASQPNVLLTISHELAHGMGALEHSWKDNGPEQGTTHNLMDYEKSPNQLPKNNLIKAQWKELRDLDVVPSLLDGMEDGSYTLTTLDYICIPDGVNISSETIFYDLDGHKVLISGDYTPYAFVGASSDQAGAVSIVINNTTGVVYYPTNINDSGYYGMIDGALSMSDHYIPQVVSSGEAVELSASASGGYVLKKGGNIIQTGTSTEMRSCPGLPNSVNELDPNESEFFEELILPSSQADALTIMDSATYQSRFNANVDKFVATLNQAVSTRNSISYNYELEPSQGFAYSKHIITVPNSQHTPYSYQSKEMAVIDQKLAYLMDYSEFREKKVECYVIAGDVNLLMAGSNWREFAKAVYEKSVLKERNAVLITIPSVHLEEHYTGVVFGLDQTLYNVTYNQPSVYAKADFSEIGLLNEGKFANNAIVPFVEAVYKNISKPVKIHRAFQQPDGSISKTTYEPQSFKTGYGFCKAIAVYRKPQHDALKEPMESTAVIGVYNGATAYGTGPLDVLNYEVKQAQLLEAAQQSDWVIYTPTGEYARLKEKYIDLFKDEYIKYVYASEFEQWAVDYYMATSGFSLTSTPPVLNSNYYYTPSTWGVVSPMVYGTLDAIGVGLGFVGLDGVTDGIGLAVACAAGDAQYAASYGTAIALIGVSGGVVNLAVHYGPSLAGKTRMLYKGLTFVLKNGEWTKISKSASYGRVFTFFKLSDENLLSVSEMEAFITKLQNGDFTHSQIASIINEPTEIARVNKMRQLTEFNLLSALQEKFVGKTNVLQWLNEVGNNSSILNRLDDLPTSAIDHLEADITVLKSHFISTPDLIRGWQGISSQPHWIRRNIDLLSGLSNKSDNFITRVNAFYNNLALPANLPRPLPSSISHPFNGGTVVVEYNKFGFPVFGPHMTNITENGINFKTSYKGTWNEVVSSHNSARSKDLRDATNWALQKDENGNLINFPNGRVRRATTSSGNPSPSKIEILDDYGNWIEQTWHHHENGIDIIPVPSDIHNFLNHSGGFAAKNGSDGTTIGEIVDISEIFNYSPSMN